MEALVTKLASGRQSDIALQELADFFANIDDAVSRNEAFQILASVMMANSGSIKQLAHLLTSEDHDIKQNALLLFGPLCEESSEFRAEIASRYSDAVVPAVIDEISSPRTKYHAEDDTQGLALSALEALAKNGKAAQAAADAGAIDALVRLMQLPSTTKQDEDNKNLAAVALRQMTQASTHRARQAASSGAIAALARLALGQDAKAQINAASSLGIIITAFSPTQASKHIQHIKVALAALARLLAPSIASCYVQEMSITVLAPILAAHDRGEHAWLPLELVKALARASAGRLLLKLGSRHSVMLLLKLKKLMPEEFLAVLRSEGAIDNLKKLLQSPEPVVAGAAAAMIEDVRATSPDLAALMGEVVDTASALERGLRKVESRMASGSSDVGSRCAKCGAVDGVGDVQLSKCSACRDVAYCSKACQKAHWKVHKPSCVSRV